ncbi:Glycosyl transferase, group 2 family protein [Roseibacterium elongatum DSM 19469]|uniref:Glycosyl transferase, group 2 family protein n=1 Tax=Roseicyclus elongatus DSM 19469 TaxID=1294273 RepID=W8SPK9_9RHOB|nr:glycosyltransferase [Roseibacterium elongatum]AHM04435.1 Glycosyl transferase, group 2 family protein [Roseibacterium elongatum DSM 19469]
MRSMDGDQLDIERRSAIRDVDIARLSSGADDACGAVARSPAGSGDNDRLDDRLAALLIGRGHSTHAQVAAAREAGRSLSLPIGQILRARGHLSEAELLSALAQLWHTTIVDLESEPPDPELASRVSPAQAIAAEAIPWRRAGSAIVIATARPDLLATLGAAFPHGTHLVPVLAGRDQIVAAQCTLYGHALAREAEGRAPETTSCRTWRPQAMTRAGLAMAALIVVAGVLFPGPLMLFLMGCAGIVFLCNLALKLLVVAAMLTRPRAPATDPAGARLAVLRPPVVTLLVPLFHEATVATHLVQRLARLHYPPERLDILLCVEAEDDVTARALAATRLPPHMRAITVPEGQPRTKPRALNYCLNYARGDIVGIYDAEDLPEPDQIARVVQRFAEVGPEVACLQGQLDYYNSAHNWIARMFTMEYASWFRVLLPGVQRLGLVVPLGGTTLFLRSDALERLGGWDAHNVTEDAELGLRLARAGYRTEIVETTTFEEANAAIRPWIRQRSRWLKGYLVTWAAAMRQPFALWRDLGTWRFVGVQAQFLAAVLGFLLSPLLWSLGIKAAGFAHPLDRYMPEGWYPPLFAVMLLGAGLTMAVALLGCRAAHLRHHRIYAPLMEVYYILGIAAAWRAVFETLVRPFFWAKTAHGQFGGTHPLADTVRDRQQRPDQSCSASSLRRTTNAMDR